MRDSEYERLSEWVNENIYYLCKWIGRNKLPADKRNPNSLPFTSVREYLING
jgi:hypothetical protein